MPSEASASPDTEDELFDIAHGGELDVSTTPSEASDAEDGDGVGLQGVCAASGGLRSCNVV